MPRQIRETRSPVAPRFTYFIATSANVVSSASHHPAPVASQLGRSRDGEENSGDNSERDPVAPSRANSEAIGKQWRQDCPELPRLPLNRVAAHPRFDSPPPGQQTLASSAGLPPGREATNRTNVPWCRRR